MRSSGIKLVSKADIASALNGISGFIAIMLFMNDDFIYGSIFLMLSILLDGLDGILARKYGSFHGRGRQIDSVADAISFCVAPAIALYSAFYLEEDPYSMLSIATLFGSSFMVFAGIVRLGEFCDNGYKIEHFIGLPTSAMALTVSASILTFINSDYLWAPPLISISVSALMLLRIRYPKPRGLWEFLSALVIISLVIMLMISRVSGDFQMAGILGFISSMIYVAGSPLIIYIGPKKFIE